MSELQAQIVFHGEKQADGLTIDHAANIYAQLLMGLGARPLKALIEIREFQENRAIAMATGQSVPDDDAFESTYELDPNASEIWVDPDEFNQAGVMCVLHRHIIVSPTISVDDMPSIDNVIERPTIDINAATKIEVERKAQYADWELELLGDHLRGSDED
jgi:hypothetical protein